MITGNVIGGIVKNPDTIIIVDEETGKEYPAVMTGEEVELTATVNDVRLGKTVALAQGVKTGEKFIPGYYTYEGYKIIPNGSSFTLTNLKTYDLYNFTKLQAIICEFNTSITDSVSATKISVYEKVFDVLSTEIISEVSRNSSNKTVDFGITNTTGKPQILRIFTYKEI